MKINELESMLELLGIPIAIACPHDPIDLPALIILPTSTESSGSDFAAELRRDSYQIELCTVQKDIAQEERLENLFDEQGIHFDKYEAYIDSEAMYQCAYQIEFYYTK